MLENKNRLSWVRAMVFNATFNNISAGISWRSILLVDETRVPGEKHRSAASHWDMHSLLLKSAYIISYLSMCTVEPG